MIRRLVVLAVALSACGLPALVPPPPPPPPVPLSERLDDLAAFRDGFMAVDRSFSSAARAEAEARLVRLEASLARTGSLQLELELAQIAALADNGHTLSFAEPRSRRYDRVPIRLVPFGDADAGGGFYVLRASAADADLLGARLHAVDGRPVADLVAAGRSLAGGTTARRDRFVPFFLESPQQMAALGVATGEGSATYRFSLDGREVERRLRGEPAGSPRTGGDASRWLFPELSFDERGVYRPLLAPERAPWAFQDFGAPLRWRAAPELEAIVIDFRQNYDLEAFLPDLERELAERRPRHLVVDMRMNGGGDLTTTRAFFAGLPARVPGRIFVLTGPWTFSAAISSTGYLEQAAPERVTIVGEEVGDRLEFWAEGRPLALLHSGVGLLPATQRHDYVTGCEPFADCHGYVVRHPIRVPTLAPDLPAPWTIDAYRAGRDPAMEKVAKALGAPSALP